MKHLSPKLAAFSEQQEPPANGGESAAIDTANAIEIIGAWLPYWGDALTVLFYLAFTLASAVIVYRKLRKHDFACRYYLVGALGYAALTAKAFTALAGG